MEVKNNGFAKREEYSKKNSVCQAKSGLVLITGMLMMSSLTACQKAEDKIDK